MSGSKNSGTFTQWNTMQQKERRTPSFYNSMDGTGVYYAQIPYDLTYKWNLMNKTNKQNRRRGMEMRNRLTVTRGERGGG